jgi:uncharacterized protein with PQ loop repeat
MSAATPYLGYAGAFFLSLVLVPQVVKTLRERSDHSSSAFLALELLASSCFVAYGYLLPGGAPVVVSNASAFLCTCVLIWAKLTFAISEPPHPADDSHRDGGGEEQGPARSLLGNHA